MAHTFTGLRAPYLPILWVGSIFCAWNYLSLGSFSLAGCITIISVVFFSVLLGNLFWIAALKRSAQFDYLSFKLLIGILLGNCLLFVISLAMPFGLIWDWILLIGLIALATLVLKVPVRSIFATNSNPEKILLLVLPLITSWWVRNLLQAPYQVGEEIRFWGSSDVLTHMAQLGVQARGHGLSSMSVYDVWRAITPLSFC